MSQMDEDGADEREAERTLRPKDFSGYIGQADLVDRLRVKCSGALAGGRPLEPILFDAPPGSGKTTVAKIVATELRGQLVTVPPNLTDEELLAVLCEVAEGGVVFFEEIHRWTTTAQGALLTLLDERRIVCKWDSEEFPNLTFLAATTEPQKLDPAITDRFDVMGLAPYSDAHLSDILSGMARRAGVKLDRSVCDALGRAAAGRPRAARKFVFAARDLRASGRSVGVRDVLAFCKVEPDGLGLKHLDYLQALQDFGGRAGLDSLSTRLRMHSSVIRDLERLLLDRRLVALDPKGRMITHHGRRRLAGQAPPRPANGAAA